MKRRDRSPKPQRYHMALCITQDLLSDLTEQIPKLVLVTEPEKLSEEELVPPGSYSARFPAFSYKLVMPRKKSSSTLQIQEGFFKTVKLKAHVCITLQIYLWFLNTQGFSPCKAYVSMYIFLVEWVFFKLPDTEKIKEAMLSCWPCSEGQGHWPGPFGTPCGTHKGNLCIAILGESAWKHLPRM